MADPDAREWLEPDGLGGFAMGTVDLIRTRRYHGILLAATRPPDARMLLVADLEVFVETPRGRYALSAHRYRGEVVYPDGPVRRTAFTWDPWPRWEWTCEDGTRIALELAAAPGRPATVLRWTQLVGDGWATLTVRPLLAGRDYHSLHHENGNFRFGADVEDGRVVWHPYDGVPAIVCTHDGTYDHAPDWYRSFLLVEERARGLDCEEDLAAPGTFTFELFRPALMAFSTEEETASPGSAGARSTPGGSAQSIDVASVFAERAARTTSGLDHAADAYIVRRGSGRTIIAGYPWFSDWGRDTFISLRGLCLSTGRRDVARDILVQWASAIDGGMLPNRYGEADATPEYNSVDAALWYVIAAGAYLAGDHTTEDARILEAAIEAIVAGYTRGTRHGIRMSSDGLLAAGMPGVQLTWMDAKIGDEVITPRIGKAVEIQALWLNALAIAGRDHDFARGRTVFAERFWAGGQLHDVVDVDGVPGAIDATCRPNQIFAVGGLPLPLLDGDRACAVVDLVEQLLWTPAGPRSLASGDPRYHGHYAGAPHERDRIYHNGPVWPWLAGAFVEAWLRVRGSTAEARAEARTRFLEPLRQRLHVAGLGHLSEICEGDDPYRPVGCPFQAWSVAEFIRIERDLLGGPPH